MKALIILNEAKHNSKQVYSLLKYRVLSCGTSVTSNSITKQSLDDFNRSSLSHNMQDLCQDTPVIHRFTHVITCSNTLSSEMGSDYHHYYYFCRDKITITQQSLKAHAFFRTAVRIMTVYPIRVIILSIFPAKPYKSNANTSHLQQWECHRRRYQNRNLAEDCNHSAIHL